VSEAPRSGSDFLAETPERLFYLIYQVHRRREVRIEQELKAVDLPMAVWRTLLAVQRMEPCTMNELAKYTTLERSSLTRTLDQMEDQGMVTRTTPPHDRRQVLVALTPDGRAAYERGLAAIRAWNRGALERLPAGRMEAALEVLGEVLVASMDDEALARDIIGFEYKGPADGA
jgi:MarR family transcriptional regulator, lower aerobic nicotinate degradation pathway regulator